MNKTIPFIFNNGEHYVGTIVSINDAYKQNFRFNSILKFIGYSLEEDAYCFTTLQDNWNVYKLSEKQIRIYIKDILKEGQTEFKNENIDPQYIDGIISAWIWYILIMFFAVFLRDVQNIIAVWLVATFIFFSWRHKKIKGG